MPIFFSHDLCLHMATKDKLVELYTSNFVKKKKTKSLAFYQLTCYLCSEMIVKTLYYNNISYKIK